MTAHTPTPWTLRDYPGYLEITGSNGRIVEQLPGASYNAAHIVRCVNAHDELVAALYDLANAFQVCAVNNMAPPITDGHPAHSAYEAARAALAKAAA